METQCCRRQVPFALYCIYEEVTDRTYCFFNSLGTRLLRSKSLLLEKARIVQIFSFGSTFLFKVHLETIDQYGSTSLIPLLLECRSPRLLCICDTIHQHQATVTSGYLGRNSHHSMMNFAHLPFCLAILTISLRIYIHCWIQTSATSIVPETTGTKVSQTESPLLKI